MIGAAGTYLLRNKSIWFAPLPPIAANTLIVPMILSKVYGASETIPYLMLTVGIGELISCGILGMMFMLAVKKKENNINWAEFNIKK